MESKQTLVQEVVPELSFEEQTFSFEEQTFSFEEQTFLFEEQTFLLRTLLPIFTGALMGRIGPFPLMGRIGAFPLMGRIELFLLLLEVFPSSQEKLSLF